MGKAILTHSEKSAYNDEVAERYHFPQRYLAQVSQALNDWIIYYEPRRDDGPSSSRGRQAYFAMARVVEVSPDPDSEGHHYAKLAEYIEFDQLVPFRDQDDSYYESALRKPDGSTNKGVFGWSVRVLPEAEFNAIVAAGFSETPAQWERDDAASMEVPESVERPLVTQLLQRRYRDQAFRRHVRSVYDFTCAVTGLRLIDGGGRPEVQAAHIRPVEENGPDTVRNGLTLTSTFHWLFDRGLISVDDEFTVLVSGQGLPDELGRLIRLDRRLRVPSDRRVQPHPTYLAWHRKNRFKP